MVEFGRYGRRESRIYTVPVEAHAIPLSLHVQLPGGGTRDFAFVPDGDTAQEFAPAFQAFSRSDALGSRFRYVSGERPDISLEYPGALGSTGRRQIRFALVKWDLSRDLDFPKAIHCLLRVPFGRDGRELHEIVTPTVEGGAR